MTITAHDIRVAMMNRFGGPEWAIMWEVAPATGAVRYVRYADAVMMSLWPSRGLDLHGIEIKISRSDWKREAADPSKAERIAAFCDFWWVHVAPGVIQDLSEVPMAWGVREWDGKTWRTIREATRTEASPVDRPFLASLLRRAEGREAMAIDDAVEKRVRAAEARIDESIKRAVEERTRHNTTALSILEEFEAAAGISMKDVYFRSEGAEIGRIIKLVQAAGIERVYGGIRNLAKNASEVSTQLEKALADYDAMATETRAAAE